MKAIFTIALLISAHFIYAQDFYDLNTVQDIQINFSESNWDQLLDAQKSGAEDYILAQSVSINGMVFDSVGVKYKGNSTYSPNQTKNPFHIELDTYKEQDYQGYKDIKLSNVAKDPSFLREVLSYQILRQYMDAPLSNYANVTVNGTLIGLYSNSEAISKTFIDYRFGSKSNTFIKCNPPAGAGPQSNDFPNLVYLGQDSLSYYAGYEIKSDGGWQDLIDLCDTLNNQSESLDQILDIDRAIWMLAFNNILVNLDSYSGRFAQNYYLYRDDNNRFVPVVWDLNESFGRFTATGTININSTTARQNMTHLLHENDSQFPLIQKLLANDTYKKMYLAHCKTMLLENFANQSYISIAEQLRSSINAHVQADGNKFFSYQNFLDNLHSDVGGGGGPGGGATIGIANLMGPRSDFLLALSDFADTEPVITNIAQATDTPVIGQDVTVTASVTDASEVILAYRAGKKSIFTKVQMRDDGASGDGDANDGVYGATMPLVDDKTQYYIYAQNELSGIFSPVRAEYEYHEVIASAGNPQLGDLVINELMASNTSTIADADGEFDDWIELYNNGSSTIDLFGYSLSDDPTNIVKWNFPEGTEIAAGGYLIIWADDDEDQQGLHTTFKLSAGGESVVLADDNGVVIDEINFEEQESDISYGRFPNGTGPFSIMTPTFGSENTTLTATREHFIPNLTIYPNPANNELYIEADLEPLSSRPLTIFDAAGRIMYTNSLKSTLRVSTAEWKNGLYIVHLGDSYRKIVIQH